MATTKKSAKKTDPVIETIDKTLNKTVEDMVHGDYVAKFRAEYRQTTTRLNRLQKTLKAQKDPAVAVLYKWQINVMQDYIKVMKLRAEVEGIKL